jgi:hypothetical protein
MAISNQSVELWRLNPVLVEELQQRRSANINSILLKAINMNILLLSNSMLEGFLGDLLERHIIYLSIGNTRTPIEERLLKEIKKEGYRPKIIDHRIARIKLLTNHDLSDLDIFPLYKDIRHLPTIRNIIAHGGSIKLSEKAGNRLSYEFNVRELKNVLLNAEIIESSRLNNITEENLVDVIEAVFSNELADYYYSRTFEYIQSATDLPFIDSPPIYD